MPASTTVTVRFMDGEDVVMTPILTILDVQVAVAARKNRFFPEVQVFTLDFAKIKTRDLPSHVAVVLTNEEHDEAFWMRIFRVHSAAFDEETIRRAHKAIKEEFDETRADALLEKALAEAPDTIYRATYIAANAPLSLNKEGGDNCSPVLPKRRLENILRQLLERADPRYVYTSDAVHIVQKAIKILLHRGADTEGVLLREYLDPKTLRCFSTGSRESRRFAVELLVQCGHWNCVFGDKYGRVALHYAVKSGNFDAVVLLLGTPGFHPNPECHEGKRVLDYLPKKHYKRREELAALVAQTEKDLKERELEKMKSRQLEKGEDDEEAEETPESDMEEWQVNNEAASNEATSHNVPESPAILPPRNVKVWRKRRFPPRSDNDDVDRPAVGGSDKTVLLYDGPDVALKKKVVVVESSDEEAERAEKYNGESCGLSKKRRRDEEDMKAEDEEEEDVQMSGLELELLGMRLVVDDSKKRALEEDKSKKAAEKKRENENRISEELMEELERLRRKVTSLQAVEDENTVMRAKIARFREWMKGQFEEMTDTLDIDHPADSNMPKRKKGRPRKDVGKAG